eukprot:6367762-Pyramimonas_sp.AAC.1
MHELLLRRTVHAPESRTEVLRRLLGELTGVADCVVRVLPIFVKCPGDRIAELLKRLQEISKPIWRGHDGVRGRACFRERGKNIPSRLAMHGMGPHYASEMCLASGAQL